MWVWACQPVFVFAVVEILEIEPDSHARHPCHVSRAPPVDDTIYRQQETGLWGLVQRALFTPAAQTMVKKKRQVNQFALRSGPCQKNNIIVIRPVAFLLSVFLIFPKRKSKLKMRLTKNGFFCSLIQRQKTKNCCLER